jgi:magnesium transporter
LRKEEGSVAVKTFYLSRILNKKVLTNYDVTFGRLKDIIVDTTFERPKIIALKVKTNNGTKFYKSTNWDIFKNKGQYYFTCPEPIEMQIPEKNTLLLVKHILDKQIVDMNGRKLVRVNDIRLAFVSEGTFIVAVDVGIEGLFRRLGIAKQVKAIFNAVGLTLPSKFINWSDVSTINSSNHGIQLGSDYSRLHTLHPSDLADIIEDLDTNTQMAIFNSLTYDQAADVLEEMEPDVQADIIENLSIEKAADVLEKMPADEVADLLDEIEEDRAEEILQEMEKEVAEDVRELWEYEDKEIGSLMTSDYCTFNEHATVQKVLDTIRAEKPDNSALYSIFVTDRKERLIGCISLRDLIISTPEATLKQIMGRSLNYVFDDDSTKILPEIISKYNLLSIPVVDEEMKILGSVVIDDVIDQLINN